MICGMTGLFCIFGRTRQRAAYRAALEQALCLAGILWWAPLRSDGPTKCSGLEIVQYDAAKLLDLLGPEFILRESKKKRMLPRQVRFSSLRGLFCSGLAAKTVCRFCLAASRIFSSRRPLPPVRKHSRARDRH